MKLAAAEVRAAYLNLERMTIVSPVTGYVAKRNVQIGARVDGSAPLMVVVPLDQIWVDANFKESQLEPHPSRPARDPALGPLRRQHGLPRHRGGRGRGHRQRLRAPAGPERHRQLDQGGAAGAGAGEHRGRRISRHHPLRIGLSMDVDVDTHAGFSHGGCRAAASPPTPPRSTTSAWPVPSSSSPAIITQQQRPRQQRPGGGGP